MEFKYCECCNIKDVCDAYGKKSKCAMFAIDYESAKMKIHIFGETLDGKELEIMMTVYEYIKIMQETDYPERGVFDFSFTTYFYGIGKDDFLKIDGKEIDFNFWWDLDTFNRNAKHKILHRCIWDDTYQTHYDDCTVDFTLKKLRYEIVGAYKVYQYAGGYPTYVSQGHHPSRVIQCSQIEQGE